MDAMMQACQKAIGCMLFEGVEQAQAMQLLQTFAQLQTFEKGQIIYSPGHYQHSLGIIVRGRAVVEKECGVLLNDLGAGQCFGAAALFVPQVFVVKNGKIVGAVTHVLVNDPTKGYGISMENMLEAAS